ncbi:hypothetical protein [Phytoactinopolyspora mesophila]|nr:hypothetical protein [Phytoactinopolyspora mesophila]
MASGSLACDEDVGVMVDSLVVKAEHRLGLPVRLQSGVDPRAQH